MKVRSSDMESKSFILYLAAATNRRAGDSSNVSTRWIVDVKPAKDLSADYTDVWVNDR